jgi:membrane associated rhomboid family serine protease
MTIVSWIIFAIINVLILFFLEYDPDKSNRFEGPILGMTGALSGSLLIYFLTRGISKELILTLSLIIILESFFLMTLLFTKSFNLKV